MRNIISIDHIESKVSKAGEDYHITHATLDDGSEARGFGRDFETGDKVEVFFHREQVKMKKPDRDAPEHYYKPNVEKV